MAITTKEKDLGFARIQKELKKLNLGPHIKVGWPVESAKSTASHTDSPLTVAQIAIIHEFGQPMKNIPERSMLRATHDAKVNEWNKATNKLVGQIYDGKITVEVALDRLGLLMLRDIKNRMRAGIPPKLKIRVGTALIDTAQMLNAMTFKRIMKRA